MIFFQAKQPLRFALLGAEVSGSLSPFLHNKALAALGLRGTYEALSIPPASVASIVAKLHEQGFLGLNVTVPYKESIRQYTMHQDPLVERLGAANTLLWEAAGYSAFNTDVWGFEKSLEALPSLQGAVLAVFGAGGAAKAVV